MMLNSMDLESCQGQIQERPSHAKDLLSGWARPAGAPLETLPAAEWHGPFDPELQRRATIALEAGKVVLLPHLAFHLMPSELDLLDPAVSGGARKNISLDPKTGALGNTTLKGDAAAPLRAMMHRFGSAAMQFVQDLLPDYAAKIERGRTSLRPNEIAGRNYSPRHDDKRLHVDAFPSRPLHGRRILRLFSNVAPDESARFWQLGEPFADFARKFMPQIKAPPPRSAWLYEWLGITKGRRSAYDHYMLRLHDRAKLNAAYQASTPKTDVYFPSGVSWLCFTDQVLHAALAGHGALEQTFHLPVEAMTEPAQSPLRILEGLAGRRLV